MDIWNVELQEICFKLRVAYYCGGVNAGFETKKMGFFGAGART